MADSNAVRQANKRTKDAAYRLLRGARDYKLTFESFRGTTAAIERLCAHYGLTYPDAVPELITTLIHDADNKLS